MKERWTEGFWGWGVWNWRNANTAQVFLVLINGWKRDFIKKKVRSFLVSPTLKYRNIKFLIFCLTHLYLASLFYRGYGAVGTNTLKDVQYNVVCICTCATNIILKENFGCFLSYIMYYDW